MLELRARVDRDIIDDLLTQREIIRVQSPKGDINGTEFEVKTYKLDSIEYNDIFKELLEVTENKVVYFYEYGRIDTLNGPMFYIRMDLKDKD